MERNMLVITCAKKRERLENDLKTLNNGETKERVELESIVTRLCDT
jgi:hypothetical protein